MAPFTLSVFLSVLFPACRVKATAGAEFTRMLGYNYIAPSAFSRHDCCSGRMFTEMHHNTMQAFKSNALAYKSNEGI